MISACLLFLAFAWVVPTSGCNVPVRVLPAYSVPVGFSVEVSGEIGAYTTLDGVTLEPFDIAPMGVVGPMILHNIMAHEMEHYRRLHAGTFDWTRPYTEELIANKAACIEAPVPWCSGIIAAATVATRGETR